MRLDRNFGVTLHLVDGEAFLAGSGETAAIHDLNAVEAGIWNLLARPTTGAGVADALGDGRVGCHPFAAVSRQTGGFAVATAAAGRTTMRQSGIAALAAIMTSLSLPALAIEERTPEPSLLYRVTGVAAGDVLNIRAQPDPAAEIAGTLEPDASGVVVAGTRMETNGAVWWQVVGGDGLGWVNARYLVPADDAPPSGDEAFPLRCTGTEPFWSVSVTDGEARFETPMDEAETWQAGPMTRAAGLTGRHAVRLESANGVGHLTAWRNHRFCSDGMSDIGFPYEGIVVTPDGTVYGGCCLRAGK